MERGNIWAEVSDKIEHWLNRCDVPRLPFRVAQELLKDKHLIPLGGWLSLYERNPRIQKTKDNIW